MAIGRDGLGGRGIGHGMGDGGCEDPVARRRSDSIYEQGGLGLQNRFAPQPDSSTRPSTSGLQDRMHSLESEMELHLKLVLELSSRLTPICAAEPDEKNAASSSSIPVCGMEEYIAAQLRRVAYASDQVRSLLDRLQL